MLIFLPFRARSTLFFFDRVTLNPFSLTKHLPIWFERS
jgi:hypothetical protein